MRAELINMLIIEDINNFFARNKTKKYTCREVGVYFNIDYKLAQRCMVSLFCNGRLRRGPNHQGVYWKDHFCKD